ncbi:RidA family protein [Devosia psychrophila]|uniref:Enamine deaminase RidA, house cleaning of reactive enamine intermediates, YjgF/YER057c/UK114 family n=1 Tax=Devosia psychrophila TaxID=728005 RepID=A0A0F5PV17_9HYPH|nr:RidA family protein [Devosia psychrophila]KKC32532.1 endoribonuclease L-PSP [Devosia psychrophila]SFD26199.1 Enamine deaminase RidA, house cleaning of reactive enamine intermediates, YjgF/YER057c/UK114 family [Devosia psychrophila]
MTHQIIQPEGWARPIGYSNGMVARGRIVQVGGQVGWDANCEFQSDDFIDQVRQTLKNVVDVLAAADAGPEHIIQMTWYFTDRHAYKSRMKEVGAAYRETIGRHFPPMAAVQVVALMEDRAKIEIQVLAVVPD